MLQQSTITLPATQEMNAFMQLCVPKTSFHGTDIILTCLCLSLYLCYWSPCCSSSSQSKGIGAFLFFHNLSIVRRYLMSSLNNCNTHTYPKSPLTDSSLPKVILKQLPQTDTPTLLKSLTGSYPVDRAQSLVLTRLMSPSCSEALALAAASAESPGQHTNNVYSNSKPFHQKPKRFHVYLKHLQSETEICKSKCLCVRRDMCSHLASGSAWSGETSWSASSSPNSWLRTKTHHTIKTCYEYRFIYLELQSNLAHSSPVGIVSITPLVCTLTWTGT